MDYEIIHQPEQKLFKTEVDGRTAFVQSYAVKWLERHPEING